MKKKWEIPFFSFYDHTGMEHHLEKRARQGWMLDKMSGLGWTFRRIPPQPLKFTVSYADQESLYEPEPSEHRQTFQEFCEHAGWKLAASAPWVQVFYNEQPDPVPIETDPDLELASIHRVVKKLLPAYILTSLLGFWMGGSWVWQFLHDPIDLLVSPNWASSAFAFGLLFVYLAADLIGYIRWRRPALRAAARDLKEGLLDAVVTAPIDKETVQSDDFRFTGHTEFFGAEFGGEPMMIMCSDILRVGLVTKHIPVSEISRSITREKIVADLLTLRRSLVEDFGVVEPRIAVMALNPHAGDGGLLGREEEEIIRPAIVEAFSKGVLAFGPFAADGLFAGGGYTRYDGILAMYHDQGLAPFKSLSPDGVNFTAGLPVVRTSPDHGTAFDIAGQDRADAQSMRNALYAAIDIVQRRRAWAEWTSNPLPRAEREKSSRDVSVKELPHRKGGVTKNKEKTGQTGGVFRLVIVEAPKAPKT